MRKPRVLNRAGPIPTWDGDFSFTADHLVDDPREPIIIPTGVLDQHGEMLVRVRTPIKVPMGFAIPNASEEPDEIVSIVPANMLSISEDTGEGLLYVDPAELEDEDEEEGGNVIRVIATEEMVAANHAMNEAAGKVGAQIAALQADLTEEGVLLLRGLVAAQTEAVIAFLRVLANTEKDTGDGQDAET